MVLMLCKMKVRLTELLGIETPEDNAYPWKTKGTKILWVGRDVLMAGDSSVRLSIIA